MIKSSNVGKIILVTVSLLVILGISIYIFESRKGAAFYVGKWEAELRPSQKDEVGMEMLTYEFGEDYFVESSIYVTEGIKVQASTRSTFIVETRKERGISGVISGRELLRLDTSFVEPGCSNAIECERRESLKSNVEKLVKKSLELQKDEASNFTIDYVNPKKLLFKSKYGKQTLRKIR